MERVPARLARDRLDDVRVDLRQRVVAREAAERVRQRRVAARVVERVAGLVQERLVVVQPALRARDQVDDRRRVGRDHAGPRRLLRPVVEVGPDVRVAGEVEAELLQRLEADVGRALLRVRRLERREPAHVRHVVRPRLVVALRPEHALEPRLAQAQVRLARTRRPPRPSAVGQRAQRDPLLLLVARDRVGLAARARPRAPRPPAISSSRSSLKRCVQLGL